jgi:hypothetical protein
MPNENVLISSVTHELIKQFVHCPGIICTLLADHYAKITFGLHMVWEGWALLGRADKK